jgi:hypothetical protein
VGIPSRSIAPSRLITKSMSSNLILIMYRTGMVIAVIRVIGTAMAMTMAMITVILVGRPFFVASSLILVIDPLRVVIRGGIGAYVYLL